MTDQTPARPASTCPPDSRKAPPVPEIRMIPVDLIDPHPHNPRRDLGDLTELAASIQAHGIRQNLLLVSSRDRYTAIIGHRRLSAARLAGLTEVPAAVDITLTEAQQLELMLLENIQRADLSPVEEAEGYQGLLDLGVKVRAIAKATGRAEKTVTGRLRLLALPEAVREQVHAGQATLEDAAQLNRFVDGTDQVDAKTLDKLAASLGTTNFKWEIQNAEHTLEKRRERAELMAACEARGIPVVKGDPDRHEYTWHAYVPGVDRLAEAGELPEGCILSDDALWRPLTDEERAETEQRGDAKQQRAEFDRKLSEESAAAKQLRDEFVRQVLQRKRLARAEIDAIVANAAPIVLTPGLENAWRISEFLGVDNRYRSTEDRLALIDEHFPDAQPAALLLLGLYLAATCWYDAHEDREMVGLYRALIALGYQLSDTERGRVFPEAEAEGEAVCTECQHPADDHDIDDGTCYFDATARQCNCTGLILAEAGA